MNFNFLNVAMITAAFGSLTMFWNHFMGFFNRISGFVIVSVEISHGSSSDIVMNYLWKHYKCSRAAQRKFAALERYIRPAGRHGVVPFEMTGRALTFLDGWKPFFVSLSAGKDGVANGELKISFVRGMFDIEQIMIEAAKEHTDNMHSSGNTFSRYYVRKMYGRGLGKDGESIGKDAPDSVKAMGENDSHRPLGITKDELGAPIAEEPFGGLSYPPHIEEFKDEIRRWKKSEMWYKSKNLNWRLGAGAFGPPGTGKTSFVRAIAQDMDMPIHIYDLTTMNNQELTSRWRESLNASPCVVLFEDLDRVFDKDKNIRSTTDHASVTLDCLLNCINGMEPANGILVFVTANDVSKLDPALGVPDEDGKSTRPGRLDRAVFFGPLDKEQRVKIATRILSDCLEFLIDTVNAGEGETGAQFEDRCGKLALAHYWGKPRVYLQMKSPIKNGAETIA